MCRRGAWRELTAKVTFERKCQRKTHEYFSPSISKIWCDGMMNTAIVSCGGVVIYRNKVLLLYKNRNGRHKGWVLPKGSLESGETLKQAALREVREESGVIGRLQKYLGRTEYSFKGPLKGTDGDDIETVSKTVHWYLMTTGSFFCKPQYEEYFVDVGFYKQHEAYHLLKYDDERQIMNRAFIARSKINQERKKRIEQNGQRPFTSPTSRREIAEQFPGIQKNTEGMT